MDDSSLSTDLAGLRLRNPVILAAGTAGVLDEMGDVLDLARVGAVVTKSITPEPREGNDPWRVVPVRGGMLNAIGLANPGIARFLADVAPRVPGVPTPVIGSVAGFSIDDYVRVAGALDAVDGIGAIELNVSCPNVRDGTEFGADPGLLRDLVGAVRPAVTRARLFVKLSPVAIGTPNGILDLARAAIETGAQPVGPNQRPGADGLCLCNTMPAMAIDVRTRRPTLANVTGGLSGPAIHPVVVRLVHQVYRSIARDSGTTLIGIGGVLRWDDAAELILAGASAVGMGTGLFVDPRSPLKVLKGLRRWAGATPLGSLVGAVETPDN